MSKASQSSRNLPVLSAADPLLTDRTRIVAGLHERLRQQLETAERGEGAAATLTQLLPLISACYEQVDDERRGVVRSMQMLAEESRSFAQSLAAEEAAHLQAVLDHIHDVVITVGSDGTIGIFNPTGERVFGYARSEVTGMSIVRLLPDIALQGSLQRALQMLAAGPGETGQRPARETRGRRQNGEEFPVEIVASLVHIQRREMYVLCLRDISQQRHAEQALRESEFRYRTLVEHAPEMIVVLDLVSGVCTDANENARRFFAIERDGVATLVLPELLAAAGELPAQTGRNAELDGTWPALMPASRPRVFEWLYRHPDGRSVATEVRLLPMPGEGGLVRASITDITARKRAEVITTGGRNVFEQIAADAPLPQVFAAIVQMIESVCGDCVAVLSLLAEDGRSFAEVVGARLAAPMRKLELHSVVDIRNGSAAAAVYLGRQVVAASIAEDPYWMRRRETAQQCGIAAAWALPIKASSGRVLGAVTVYRAQTGAPPPADLDLMQHAARLAAIATERRRAVEALRTSEASYRGLYESVLEGVYRCGPSGQLLAVNPAFVKMLGYADASLLYALPGVATLYWAPAERAAFEQRLQGEGEVHNAEVLLRRRDGQQVVVLESARVLRDEAGRVIAYEGTIADITARKRAEQAMFAEKERAQVTLQSIGDAVITTDSEGRIEYLNPVAEQLSGWSSAEARGQSINTVLRLLDDASRSEIDSPLLRCLREGKVVDPAEQSVLVNRAGQELAIQDSAAPIRDRAGAVVGGVVVFRDVTKERRLKRALSYQAIHDALTGLINRREFDNRLQTAVQGARNGEGAHALLYVDLDQFKVVNDTCGHSAGDRLLRDVTALLQQQVRASDTIARLGGDEFGILVQHCSVEQAVRVADNIRQAVHDYRFTWERTTTTIGASIGVVEISRDSESAASLMSAADIACYAAKDAGRNRVHVYESTAVSGRHREMYWVSRVTRAVDEGRLELYQQPIVPTVDGVTTAPPFRELLVRLRGDGDSLIMPGEFIPAAERYNVISAIDRWVVRRAVDIIEERRTANPADQMQLAVNLSGTSLSEQSFLDYVLGFVEDARIASGLCFEITETAVITNMTQAVYFMRELKKRGCRFALDDFGSGVASFHYLKTLPVDYLKIDGQFIANVVNDAVDRSMIEAICKVAGALGIATVAEKVETAAVREQLALLKVDFVQGFLVARPQPLVELPAP